VAGSSILHLSNEDDRHVVCLTTTTNIAIYYYYSVRKLILIIMALLYTLPSENAGVCFGIKIYTGRNCSVPIKVGVGQ